MNVKDGGWLSIDPSSVRAVVAAEGGGSLIWFARGHEAVLKDEPDVVSQKLGLNSKDHADN